MQKLGADPSITFEMPLAIYQGFMGRCVLTSREYEILRNCVISHVPEYLPDGNVVEFLCKMDDAELLLKHARSFYPMAISFIEEGIRRAQALNAGKPPPEYRKTADGDTWHFYSGCSRWPTDDFIASERAGGPLCNECVVSTQQMTSSKKS